MQHTVQQQGGQQAVSKEDIQEMLNQAVNPLKVMMESFQSDLGGVKTDLGGVKTDLGAVKTILDYNTVLAAQAANGHRGEGGVQAYELVRNRFGEDPPPDLQIRKLSNLTDMSADKLTRLLAFYHIDSPHGQPEPRQSGSARNTRSRQQQQAGSSSHIEWTVDEKHVAIKKQLGVVQLNITRDI